MMQSLPDFLAQNAQIIEVTLSAVRGSAPRDAGTVMYVTDASLWGTIGGGQLEFMTIERARTLLTEEITTDVIDVPLGPEIGQCCGGRVTVTLRQMNSSDKQAVCALAQQSDGAVPHVYILGAGHVGRAIADQLQHQPVKCVLIDTRAEQLAQCNATVETRLRAIPEMDIQSAPAGSAFIVLTHDHALDFLLTSAAMARRDAAYVGMIGSTTKRAKFANWCQKQCSDLDTEPLKCPIGVGRSRDKRPSVIAAFVAAEVLACLTDLDVPQSISMGNAPDRTPRQHPAPTQPELHPLALQP